MMYKGEKSESPEDVRHIIYLTLLRGDKAMSKLRVAFDALSHKKGSPSLNDSFKRTQSELRSDECFDQVPNA